MCRIRMIYANSPCGAIGRIAAQEARHAYEDRLAIRPPYCLISQLEVCLRNSLESAKQARWLCSKASE